MTALRFLYAALLAIVRQLDALVGAALFVAGVAWFSIGAALMVAGAGIFTFAVFGGRITKWGS